MNFFTKWGKRLQWAFTSKKKKQELMDSALSVLCYDPKAKALLEMARADGIEISFSSSMIGSGSSGAHVSKTKSNKQYIKISPESKSENEIAPTLVHELRHYWQYKTLGISPGESNHIKRNPRISFIFNRVIEADAFAFEENFVNTANETFDALIETVRNKKSATTKEEELLINDALNSKIISTLEKSGERMKNKFISVLADKKLSDGYDLLEARSLHLWHTSSAARVNDFDKVKSIPELTISDIRRVLKAGVSDAAPGYMDDLTDRQFEAMVLRHANKEARQVVRLMEKFKTAAASNDNKTAKSLRKRVQEKVFRL